MNIHATELLRTVVLTAVVVTGFSTAAAAAPAPQQEASATEDVVYMRDGRILHGQIVEETRAELVFKYVDPNVNIETTLRLNRADVDTIKRDVPLDVAPADTEPSAADTDRGASSVESPSSTSSFSSREERMGRVYGARRGAVDNEDLPKFYIIPMTGQMGTDINSEVYQDMIDDIRAHDPDVLVIKMDCENVEETEYYGIEEEVPDLSGSFFLDKYREIVNLFHDELRDIPQVMWVKNSKGISSVVALSWKDMYMQPDGVIGGLAQSAGNFLAVQHDENTFGKYREAYRAWLKGFVEYGDVDTDLVDAMMIPEYKLSATWKGRDVEWSTDTSGQYIVDDSDEATVNFSAKNAEDLIISDGTAESLNDLALLLGMREYRVADGKGEEIYEKHKENWRRTFDVCVAEIQEFGKYMSWASGPDQVKYYGRAKSSLEKVLAGIRRYEAVEIRLAMAGVTESAIITQIEILKENIRAARSGAGGGAGGGRGGGAFGGAGGRR